MKTRDIVKYPRTRHIESSRYQPGDEDMEMVPFSHIRGRNLVVEDKIDGGNFGISFDDTTLLLQSRGHYLLGNDKPHFSPLKTWANTWKDELYYILGDQHIMYGENMYAFHSVFYDLLPHYFMEFDIYDKQREVFLDTPTRHAMLASAGVKVCSVPVLKTAKFDKLEDITGLHGVSGLISEQAPRRLEEEMKRVNLPEDIAAILMKLNKDRLMEGLYLKLEEDGVVKERFKWVRGDFVQSIKQADTHWDEREPIPNILAPGATMY